jgi:tripartite-type tricarboxylate transporter receptor subunit TctC
VLSLELDRVMKTTVVVENKAGAGGTIATSFVAKASADGHNLLLGTGGMMTINPFTYANLAFDTAKNFTAIALVAYTPPYLAVRTRGCCCSETTFNC